MYVGIHDHAFYMAFNTLQIPWQGSMIGKQISDISALSNKEASHCSV